MRNNEMIASLTVIYQRLRAASIEVSKRLTAEQEAELAEIQDDIARLIQAELVQNAAANCH